MRLRYTARARQTVDDILAYVAARSPQGAARLSERIEEAATLIGEHPEAGEATERPSVRRVVLTPYPYILFYRVTDTAVIVQRVRHAARRA